MANTLSEYNDQKATTRKNYQKQLLPMTNIGKNKNELL